MICRDSLRETGDPAIDSIDPPSVRSVPALVQPKWPFAIPPILKTTPQVVTVLLLGVPTSCMKYRASYVGKASVTNRERELGLDRRETG